MKLISRDSESKLLLGAAWAYCVFVSICLGRGSSCFPSSQALPKKRASRSPAISSGRRRKIERFIESVKGLPELITEFDESLWAALVDSMTVNSKDRIVFRLTCAMEIEA